MSKLLTVNMMNFSFSTCGKIVFGPGCLREIGGQVSDLASQVLIVTGRGFLSRSGRLPEVERCLRGNSVEVTVFADVPPEPSLTDVERGIVAFREHGCDAVLAIGGGSVIDVGKAIAALADAPAGVTGHFQGRLVERKGYPFIAVPTTAGSGAEVTPNAVLVDEEHGVKASIRSEHMLADVALVDPELLLSLPKTVTAHSGMDALAQAVEAFVSRGASPLTDALAEEAVARLMVSLPLAYRDGDNIEYRTQTALGSLLGGIAFANARLGLVHGMAHPLGVISGLPHGLVCALLLPHVLRYNAPACGERYAHLAARAGISPPSADSLIEALEALNTEMGIVGCTPIIRISREKRPAIVEQTLSSGSTKCNPRFVSAEDVEHILAAL